MARCEGVTIDYGAYFNCTIHEFFLILCGESIINEHHVFPGTLYNGSYRKENLSREELEEKFGISLKKTIKVLASAHCMNNRLFKNSPPPVSLGKLSFFIESEHIGAINKQCFIKFCLCVLKEKLEVTKQAERFASYGRKVKKIEIDINNGNNITDRDVMNLLGLNESNIVYYLEKNFFPQMNICGTYINS